MTRRWITSAVIWVLVIVVLVMLPVPLWVMALVTIPMAIIAYLVAGKPPWLS